MHFDDKPPKCYWDHDAIVKIGQYFITYKKVSTVTPKYYVTCRDENGWSTIKVRFS